MRTGVVVEATASRIPCSTFYPPATATNFLLDTMASRAATAFFDVPFRYRCWVLLSLSGAHRSKRAVCVAFSSDA
eukprot:scaffold23614_cov129-Isochrysis_galbana.AAC.3